MNFFVLAFSFFLLFSRCAGSLLRLLDCVMYVYSGGYSVIMWMCIVYGALKFQMNVNCFTVNCFAENVLPMQCSKQK